MALSAARDLLLFATAPAAFLHFVMASLLQLQLRCLRTTWGMLRGTRTHKPRAALQLWLREVAAARKAARAESAAQSVSASVSVSVSGLVAAAPQRSSQTVTAAHAPTAASATQNNSQPQGAKAVRRPARTGSVKSEKHPDSIVTPEAEPAAADAGIISTSQRQRRLLDNEALWGAATKVWVRFGLGRDAVGSTGSQLGSALWLASSTFLTMQSQAIVCHLLHHNC